MTSDQATDEVNHLADLFPRTNQGQLDFWHRVFQRYDVKPVRAAVLKYAEFRNDFIDRTELRAAIENEIGIKPAKVLERHQGRKFYEQHVAAEAKTVEKNFASINAALARLDDAELEALKKRVVESYLIVNPTVGKVIRESDPKTGKLLRCLMADSLGQVE